jgi:predicted ATP-grasp superfamily ATP-dependent carboligase
MVRRLRWHGGGSLEFVRDYRSRLWLIDANARFPAWIHGATLGGINLPAALVAAASGQRPRPSRARGSSFARVVIEVSVPPSTAGQLAPHVVE